MKDDFRSRVATLFKLIDPSDEELFELIRAAVEKSTIDEGRWEDRNRQMTPERYAAGRHPNCSCGTGSRGACIVHSQAAADAAGASTQAAIGERGDSSAAARQEPSKEAAAPTPAAIAIENRVEALEQKAENGTGKG